MYFFLGFIFETKAIINLKEVFDTFYAKTV